MEQIRVIRMVHDQQREMLDRKSRRIEHRIISLHHPHVRPIVRGEARRETEFGAKLTASLENGYSESDGFPERPAMKHPICKPSVNATTNTMDIIPKRSGRQTLLQPGLRYFVERGIRLSGPKLGRPTKVVDSDILKQQLTDNSARNAIEGKFGQCKRRLWLGRMMAQRKDSSETVIAITILTANYPMEQEAARLLFLSALAIGRSINVDEYNEDYRIAAW